MKKLVLISVCVLGLAIAGNAATKNPTDKKAPAKTEAAVSKDKKASNNVAKSTATPAAKTAVTPVAKTAATPAKTAKTVDSKAKKTVPVK